MLFGIAAAVLLACPLDARAGHKEATMKPQEAISGTVTGNDQHVGFRAMIMKQAIEYDLAGYAKNLPNDVVSFTLQGDADRLDKAVAAIREGTKKSSNIKVATTPGTVDQTLDKFTIFAQAATSPTPMIWSSSCDTRTRRFPRPT
jgi:acylphosphatase